MLITKHDDLFRFIETRFQGSRCLDCGAVSIDGEHNGNHTIRTEIRISMPEWEELKKSFRHWENNFECPVCGHPLGSPELAKIRSAETGLNYCSEECAVQDVKAKRPLEGY